MQNVLLHVMEMFPSASENEIKELLSLHGVNQTVSLLLSGDESSSNVSIKQAETLDSLISQHSARFINRERDSWIEVSRSNMYSRATHFYKSAKASPQKLAKNFVVEFTGEEGIDAGALKGDFFEHIMREVDSRLFEGDSFNRFPIKDHCLEAQFELAGMMVAHSVLNGGPSLSNLHPLMYTYLFSGNVEDSLQYPVSVEEIPLNAGSDGLIKFIKEVSIAWYTYTSMIYVLLLADNYWSMLYCCNTTTSSLSGTHGPAVYM